MTKPFFSIIIPTYNRAHFLKKTLNSVLIQKFEDWECIVVDDGSTDETRDVVQSIEDPRIKYFWKKREERSRARNYGISKAVGSYVCFLDSDDEYYPNHLDNLYQEIERRDFAVALYSAGMNENRGGVLTPRPVFNESIYDHPVFFIWEQFILINSICVHREILESNLFPEEYNVWEDTHLWLRVVAQHPFYQLTEITSQWNIHKNGSVTEAFQRVNLGHVRNYINCISDLFQRYEEILKPFLDEHEVRRYKLRKLKMFMGICFQKNNYYTFGRLYLFARSKVNKRQLNIFASGLIKNRIKGKAHILRSKFT